MSSGLPHGSDLGPIIFLVFINDLPEKLSSQVRLFADDTAVYLTIGGLDDGTVLQNDLDKLSLWESQWDMEFNPSKCQVVQVTTSRKAINTAYTLHGQILELVTSARYLMVDISSGLSWNSHNNYSTTIFRSNFAQIVQISVEKYKFSIFAYEFFKVKLKKM